MKKIRDHLIAVVILWSTLSSFSNQLKLQTNPNLMDFQTQMLGNFANKLAGDNSKSKNI